MAPPNVLWAKIWRDAEKGLKELGGPAPKIQAEFDLEVGRPESAKAEVFMTGSGNVWRGVELPRMEARITVGNGMAKLEKLQIQLERGEFGASGWANFKTGLGGFHYYSDADLKQFEKVAGGYTAGLRDWHSAKPPQLSGDIEFAWKEEPKFLWTSRLEVGEFRLGKTVYRGVKFPWVTDGKKWMVQGFQILGVHGSLDVQLKFDGKAELLGSVRSDLDLEGFKVWFGLGRVSSYAARLELRLK
jgi:hypothetical protein